MIGNFFGWLIIICLISENFSFENERFLIDVNQGTAEAGVQGQYTNPWDGQLDHIVNVSFTDGNHARHFLTLVVKFVFRQILHLQVLKLKQLTGLQYYLICKQ